jgi:hypothetical protein
MGKSGMIKIDNLFGLPIFRTKIDPNLYDKKEIIESISKNYEKDSKRNRWDKNSNLHQNYGDYKNPNFIEVNFKSLFPIYHDVVYSFLDEIKFKSQIELTCKIDLVNYTCTKSEQFMLEHNHLPYVFSAIHYIKFNNNEHSSTKFHSPTKYGEFTKQLFPETFLKKIDFTYFSNSWLYHDWKIDTEEDDFIMFPAILAHSIPTQISDELRITSVMNIFIE